MQIDDDLLLMRHYAGALIAALCLAGAGAVVLLGAIVTALARHCS